MKVENGTNYLFDSQRTRINTGKSTDSSASFAAIMAEKLQQTTASNTTAAKTTETSGAGKYDFTSISRNELLETVNGLMGSGHLTLDDTSSLLGMMGSSPLQKVNYDGKPLEGGDVPMNVFSKIQEGIDGARSRNETGSVAGLQRAAEALMKFQKPGISIRA